MNWIDLEDPAQLIKVVSYGATAAATAALVAGPAFASAWRLSAAAAVIGGLSIVTIARNWGRPLGSTVFAAFVAVAGLGILEGAHPLWSLIGVSMALVAWDLHSFRLRVESVDAVGRPQRLLRKHLTRLGAVAALGFALGATALYLRVDYGVGTVVGLALLLVLGLSRVVAQIRRESD